MPPEITNLVGRFCTIEDAWLAEENTDSICEDYPERDQSAPRREPRKRNTPGDRPWNKKKTSGHPRTSLDGFLDKPCPIHAILINSCPTHSLHDSWVLRQVAKGGSALLAGASCHLQLTSEEDKILMIYETFMSNNRRKHASQEINSVRQVPSRGAWIDTPMPFDHNNSRDRPQIGVPPHWSSTVSWTINDSIRSLWTEATV